MSSSASSRLTLLVCGAIAILTFLAYSHVVECGFITFDDGNHITNNPLVLGGLTWGAVKDAFLHPHASLWIPLTWISFMIDTSIFGLSAAEMHTANLLLHAANAVLLFLLLKRMTSRFWPSAAVAVLFALHPINVESVAWVTERKNVLCWFFGLLSLYSYTVFAQRESRIAYVGALTLFALALLAKPMLVPLPPGLLLLDIWPLKRLDGSNWIRRSLEKLPFLLLALGSSVMTMRAALETGVSVAQDVIPAAVRVSNAIVAYGIYLAQLVWPKDLCILYPHKAEVEVLKVSISLAVIVGITIVGWLVRRRHPYVLIGWLWFLGMLVPMLGLVQVGIQAHADRFTYVAQLGIFVPVIWLIADLWGNRPRRFLVYAGCIAGVGLMLATLRQVEHWTSSVILFEHAIAVTENNLRAYHNAGVARSQIGDYPAAIAHYTKSLEMGSTNEETWSNLSAALIHVKRFAAAVAAARQALMLDPNFTEARFNLASACAASGDEAGAIAEYRRLAQEDPVEVSARYHLGILLTKRGEIDAAREPLQEAVRLRPGDPKIAEALRKVAKEPVQ